MTLPAPFNTTLTERQVITLFWLLHYGTYKETAKRLHLSPRSVEGTVERVNTNLSKHNSLWTETKKEPLIKLLAELGVFDLIRRPGCHFVNKTQL